jgi:cephalosporin hydroxylase
MSIDKLDGWFDFQEIYTQAVTESTNESILVEIGVAFGKSAAFLANRLIACGKKSAFYAVDPWFSCVDRLTEEANAVETKRLAIEGGPFNAFISGMRLHARDELERTCVLRLTSVQAARLFEPKTVDFVFIDGLHTYKNVLEDIDAWKPLIKSGGVLSGHDYDAVHPEVQMAVHDRFGQVPNRGNSWWVRL